ncbi:MAG TPA: hypothetical protein VGL29_16880, partial [Blastocatellia bacterium]
SNSQSYDRELASYWQVQTVETLKNSVFVITQQGDKVPLSRYAVSDGGREFQLVFPREYKAGALVGPKDKAFRLEFTHPRIGVPKETRVLLEFKVEKMLIDDKVAY